MENKIILNVLRMQRINIRFFLFYQQGNFFSNFYKFEGLEQFLVETNGFSILYKYSAFNSVIDRESVGSNNEVIVVHTNSHGDDYRQRFALACMMLAKTLICKYGSFAVEFHFAQRD